MLESAEMARLFLLHFGTQGEDETWMMILVLKSC